jgi:uncharacterized membrane protein YraQ (UPF0718 family)
MGAIFSFLNDAILKMTWLYDAVGSFVKNVIGLDLSTTLGGAVHFFIYDVIKIFILLAVLIFFVSYIQSFFPPEKTKQMLGKYKGIKGNLIGALLGTLTPFCSCSSIPIFIGFTSAGVPLGISFSFLISSPFVDIASFMILLSLFGLNVALIYMVVGILLAVIGGTIIEKLGMEDQLADFVRNAKSVNVEVEELDFKGRVEFAIEQVKKIIRNVWPYIFVGVGIGALIHNVIPQEFIDTVLGSENPFSVIIAAGVGIPIYADIFGTIPIAEALFAKMVSIGTILTFMMAVTALSLPSMVMISKVVKKKLMFTFITIVTIGIIIIGYLFNFLEPFIV